MHLSAVWRGALQPEAWGQWSCHAVASHHYSLDLLKDMPAGDTAGACSCPGKRLGLPNLKFYTHVPRVPFVSCPLGGITAPARQ